MTWNFFAKRCWQPRKTPTNIADSLISVNRKYKDAGINGVIVSSIVDRKSSRFQMKINEGTSMLKDLCVINGFTFIGNANCSSNICDDLLHLIKYSGTCKLANNPINVLKRC